jgi:adenosyl cobinamide kinase/adenosyl cobinamide phosphate guanylyltransferase
MKIFLIAAAILIAAGSIFADYKWRQWIARHRRDRDP